jgi:hypothetical protein
MTDLIDPTPAELARAGLTRSSRGTYIGWTERDPASRLGDTPPASPLGRPLSVGKTLPGIETPPGIETAIEKGPSKRP